MIVEMTTAEQQQYLRHDDNSGSRLAASTPMMLNGNARSTKIVEGGYCPATRYEEKLQEQEAQHAALQAALKDYGYNITLPINNRTIWVTVPQYIFCLSTDWYRAWTCKQSNVQAT